MKRHSTVGVVIPHYNAAEQLARALESIAGQTLQVDEVIIVDDCSSYDEKRKVLEQIEKYKSGGMNLRLVEMPVNSGPATCRNLGWDIASSDYLAFIDSDDEWHPQKIAIQLAAMERNPDVEFTSHSFSDRNFDAGMRDPQLVRRRLVHWILKNRASTPSVMLRRSLSLRFPQGARYSEDYELWLSLVVSGVKTGYIKEFLARAHKPLYGSGGLSSHLWRMQLGESRALTRALLSKPVFAPIVPFALGWSWAKFARRLLARRVAGPMTST